MTGVATLSIESDGGRYSLHLKGGHGPPVELPDAGDLVSLRTLLEGVDEDLLRIRRNHRRHDLRWDVASCGAALRDIRDIGAILLNKLLGRWGYRLPELRKHLESAVEPAVTAEQSAGLIECREPFDINVPIEIMPLFPGARVRSPLTVEHVETMARSLPGFGTVVRHVSEPGHAAGLSQGIRLIGDPHLRIQFVRHSGLPAVASELSTLTSLDSRISVDGPWPGDEGDLDEPHFVLAGHLHNPMKTFTSETDELPPAQIQHFACHCRSADDGHEASWLAVQGSGPQYQISIDQLHLGLYEHRLVPVDCERPLVFLNACESAAVDSRGLAGFVQLFLQNGNRAVIGTHSRVPDRTAAEFSRLFYDELLRHRPVGQVIRSSRRRLLEQNLNPFGLLYVLYGDERLVLQGHCEGVLAEPQP